MRGKGRSSGLFLAPFLAAAMLASISPSPAGVRAGGARLTAPAAPQTASLPAPAEIEQQLLTVLNAERETRGLPVLRPSQRLAALARAHSSEMAGREILSHESAAGGSFSDRLVDAAVFFASNGENVARSGTYLAKLIHESFMGSPGHRENVLNPLFDEVGIGIVAGAGNTYYVTEDFIRALVEKPAPEVRTFIRGVLDEARAAAGRPPIVLLEQADREAQEAAEKKAAGHSLPSVPSFFGETLVRVASGPDLDMVAGRIRGGELAEYGRAGIGVWFGRTSEFPGGAYFVCALLIRDSRGPGPGSDDLERLLTVLAAVNEFRAKTKLAPLELDAGLSERADAVIAMRKTGRFVSDKPPLAKGTFYFSMFAKLRQLDEPLRKGLEDPSARKIGISTLPIRTSNEIPIGYAVAVVLGR